MSLVTAELLAYDLSRQKQMLSEGLAWHIDMYQGVVINRLVIMQCYITMLSQYYYYGQNPLNSEYK